MGIRGLNALIDANPQLLTNVKLQNTVLVVDGNNFMHYLYHQSRLRYDKSGEYHSFAVNLRNIFGQFQECYVEPYVLLDGGMDKPERKLKVQLDRMRHHIEGLRRPENYSFAPLMCIEVMIAVMEEMNIKYAMCPSEADSHIYSLACSLNAPVLSNDSDFCIFPLMRGVVKMEHLELEVVKDKKKKGKFMPCKVFHQNTLISKYSRIDPQYIALLATLMGNDFVDNNVFLLFYSKVKLPVHDHRLDDAGSKRFQQLLSLLMWLDNMPSCDVAIDKIVSCYPEGKHKILRQMVVKSMFDYTHIDNSMYKWFVEERPIIKGTVWQDKEGVGLPDWFIRSVLRAAQGVNALNCLVLHRVLLPPQLESAALPSSHQCSSLLRLRMYQLVHSSRKTSVIEEYSRNGASLHLKHVAVEKFNAGCTLCDLWQLEKSAKRKLLLDSFGNFSLNVSEDMLLFCLSIAYWARHAKVSTCHVLAVLLCPILLNVKLLMDKQLPQPNNPWHKTLRHFTSIQEALNGCSKYKLWKQLGHYVLGEEKLAIEDLHVLAQFQSVYSCATDLNSLLMRPLPVASPDVFWQGSTIANTYAELSALRSPFSVIIEQLGSDTSIGRFFKLVYETIACNLHQCDVWQGKKKLQRQRRRAQRATQKSLHVDEDSDEEEEDEENMTASCQLNNRFAQLLTI